MGHSYSLNIEKFLALLDCAINFKLRQNQSPSHKLEISDSDRDFYNQISEKIERMNAPEDGVDISQILSDQPNPLHEKSGKAEASMFLTHLQQKSKS